EAVVHPEIRHHPRMEGAPRLCDLIFMMREHKIDAAPVNVESLAKQRGRHRRTFDMPTGAATSPRTVPSRKFGWRGLPQHKIHRIVFVRSDLYACACNHLVE